MRKYWTKEEEQFIRENLNSLSIKEFSEYFHVKYDKVVKIHKMGLNSKKARNIIWSKNEDELLSRHFEYAPKDYLLKLFPNRTWPAIIQRGIKTLKLNRLSQDKIYINYEFFDEWTPQSAYIHGFILADGHIHLGKDNFLQIEVNCDSLDILKKIKNAMDFQGEIYYLKNRNTYKFQNKNTHIIKRLAQTGILLKNKSHEAIYPLQFIPQEFIRDHIRGLIDGDGWSYIDGEGVYNIGLCGTQNMVTTVKDLLNIDCSKNKVQHYEENCWRFNLKGKKALEVASWLYNKSNIYLEKKYNAFKTAYNNYILRHTGNCVRTGRETQ